MTFRVGMTVCLAKSKLPGHLDVKLQGAQAAVLEQLADELIFTTDAQAAIKLMTQRLA